MSRLALLPALCAACFAQEAPVSFEVATIKPARPDALYAGIPRGGPGTSDPELFTVESMTLRDFIALAYKVRTFQIAGPAWLEKQRYDIVAKVPPGATRDQFEVMMQSLLAERFNLKLHHEKRAHAVYELVVDKGGLKLKASDREQEVPESNKPLMAITGTKRYFMIYPQAGGLVIAGVGMSVGAFGSVLESQFDNMPVLDKTGLTGTYDFHVAFAKNDGAADSSLPGLFTAVQEACGLRLQAAKADMDYVVVDHIDPPGDN